MKRQAPSFYIAIVLVAWVNNHVIERFANDFPCGGDDRVPVGSGAAAEASKPSFDVFLEFGTRILIIQSRR
ncbi:hypothetical protein WT41_01530 [Burkholderia territorii]|nr:hypothetical protein WT41_01530 [Burkholderia territorii]